jgi:hypothetical protein
MSGLRRIRSEPSEALCVSEGFIKNIRECHREKRFWRRRDLLLGSEEIAALRYAS